MGPLPKFAYFLRPRTTPTASIARTPLRLSTHLRGMSTARSTAQHTIVTSSSASPDAKQTSEQPLPLPEPFTETSAATLDASNGQGVKLDHLGPMVVNKDGTLSRIANWEYMTEIERSNTVRILGKRNMLRKQALEKEESEGTGAA